MLHYHGTPIGGKAVERSRFIQGRHGLVSFLRQDDINLVADLSKSFILDNGAFSAWKRNVIIDWERYYLWVDTWYKHPGFQFCFIPDTIDGGEDENDRLLECFPKHLPGVPIWHLHESIDRAVRLSKQYKTIALGSSGEYKTPNSKIWWIRIKELMESICDENGRPNCKLHGLRMLNPKIFTKLPLASADSSCAVITGGMRANFGIYVHPSTAQRQSIIADRIEAFNSAPTWGSVSCSSELFCEDDIDNSIFFE